MPKDPVGLPATSSLAADEVATSKSSMNELAEIPQKETDKQEVATSTAGASSANDLPSVSSSLATSGSASGNPADALSNGATTTTTTTVPSKKQLKRAQRYEKKMEIKKRRKLQDKEVKEANAKAQGRDLERVREEQAAARALAAAGNNNSNRQKNRWEQIHGPLLERSFQVCVDCAFAEQMTAKEIGSLAIQLRYCYSENRHNPHPCRLAATSVTGATLGHLQNVAGFAEWGRRGFTVTSDSMEQYYGLLDAGPATDEHEHANDDDNHTLNHGSLDNIVYLTSDSDTVLHDLDDTKIYVIGGIVDRNRLRRATLNRATALGVATARLPIDEHLELGGVTRVLTVNSVFELLLQFRQHNRDWKKALLHVLPPRKNAHEHQVEEKKQSMCSSDSNEEEPSPSEESSKGGDASASLVGAGLDSEVGQNVAGSCQS